MTVPSRIRQRISGRDKHAGSGSGLDDWPWRPSRAGGDHVPERRCRATPGIFVGRWPARWRRRNLAIDPRADCRHEKRTGRGYDDRHDRINDYARERFGYEFDPAALERQAGKYRPPNGVMTRFRHAVDFWSRRRRAGQALRALIGQ